MFVDVLIDTCSCIQRRFCGRSWTLPEASRLMATDHQVALSRSSHRLSHVSSTPTNHVSKQTRQVVPAFLQKLYEMVNDPKNGDLIRWSDTGDSFFG